jgi:tRNA(adenine34) deaminase
LSYVRWRTLAVAYLTLVFGAWDEKAGACGSVFDVPRDPRLNHRCQVRGGVLESLCQTQLRSFFASLRQE